MEYNGVMMSTNKEFRAILKPAMRLLRKCIVSCVTMIAFVKHGQICLSVGFFPLLDFWIPVPLHASTSSTVDFPRHQG